MAELASPWPKVQVPAVHHDASGAYAESAEGVWVAAPKAVHSPPDASKAIHEDRGRTRQHPAQSKTEDAEARPAATRPAAPLSAPRRPRWCWVSVDRGESAEDFIRRHSKAIAVKASVKGIFVSKKILVKTR